MALPKRNERPEESKRGLPKGGRSSNQPKKDSSYDGFHLEFENEPNDYRKGVDQNSSRQRRDSEGDAKDPNRRQRENRRARDVEREERISREQPSPSSQRSEKRASEDTNDEFGDRFKEDLKDFEVASDLADIKYDYDMEIGRESRGNVDRNTLERMRKEEEKVQKEARARQIEDTRISAQPRKNITRKDDKGRDIYVDEKNKRIAPFGGRIMEGRYDSRVNAEKKKKLVRNVTLGLLVLTVAFGAKNAVFPAKPLTEQEIQNIAASVTGQTGFPIDNGAAFAERFINAYVTTKNDAESQILQSYQPKGSTGITRNVTGDIKQEVINPAVAYKKTAVTATSANYIVGVTTSSVSEISGDKGNNQKPTISQEFFSVNVYYDPMNNSYSIANGSPTLTAPIGIGSTSEVPKDQPVGNGVENKELKETVKATIEGFIKGYAESSAQNFDSIKQYSIAEPPATLRGGMGGAYSPEQNIIYKVYNTDSENEIKAVADVTWVKKSPEGSVENSAFRYPAKYVVTMVKTGDGRYLVSDFKPYIYIPGVQ